MTGGDSDAVFQALRATEPERYWPLLYVRQDRRGALGTLQAFDAEIAGIPSKVSEPLPGEIRIQWWRDLLAGGGEIEAGGPLARQLTDVIETYQLPRGAFDRLLEARIADLYHDPFPDRVSLEAYFGSTASTILQLSATVLDRQAASSCSEASGHGGCAAGAVRLLQRFAADRARGRVRVPLDILAACGLDRESFLAAPPEDERLRSVADAMLALARHHLGQFRDQMPAMPDSIRPAFLPLALVEREAALLSRDPRRIVEGRPQPASPISKQWTLLRRAVTGWR